ncbi:conserved Plasmodium protein, unknown function [Plasmodium knowlesi strain H]|uniref:Uncharacterized protein n=3 Tax=Plasmodium knowlesi TaxID=5850 RepID=A0A5K1V4X1_PLAKH|nr:conserved Plasmodium protein, unknown function [Plasmodium knowlesi strain H]OTN67606.1 Arp2/3 complex 34 kDa subunit [Plasmodium knowlesi]CAA9990318.1 conserved Plasmodium protein, unknown function [Plasmodium knowlesi strain H]SBO19524.1 conserved Plasmodium protein, unknown function [Plasmodium knowlesi strain H]SBO22789.1 conserved Plasmodium protein, unknown function [Plasmodium knowlesi strain H]VVS79792.1 conserved Plasmodium protein, unknown function [Plasmodium knowlesi strain H]|eukprot:XP_002260718.1 hypothetical protein, conserved in Plasmodium species [Plasmodium knowlesi strain H]
MCERLYRKIKELECESNLYLSNNKALFESIHQLLREGVPSIPSACYVDDKVADRETNRYVLTKYIYDADGIIYKVEAHSKVTLEKETNATQKFLDEEYLTDNEVEDMYKEDQYNVLDSVQIYVAHSHFEHVWNEHTMQYFLSCYHDEQNLKIHTHILEKEEFGYDIQIELFEVPRTPEKMLLVANHLSKIREALQCGPFMHFFLSNIHVQENSFTKFIIRRNEVIYLLKKNDYVLVILSVHYVDKHDRCIVLGVCKSIHATTKSMDLHGHLDFSFYSDFPAHLVPSELFVYEGTDNGDSCNYDTCMEGSDNTDSGVNLDATSDPCYLPQRSEQTQTTSPNVGFVAIKMDAKLFAGCKDFSELIQISSRVSHIIVSFRDFLNNAAVLYRMRRRRAV